MFNFTNNKNKSVKKPVKEEADKPDFWDWLINGTGSVGEPWPTTKEVLQDPAVQKEIQKVREAFEGYQNKKKDN